jgi:hypothetical protein
MSNIQILVNNGLGAGFQSLDLPDDNTIKFSLYKSVQDFRDPLKATGAVSLPFTLPTTNRNKAIFLNDDEKQKLGKFKGVYQAQLILDNETLIEGELNVTKVKGSSKGFEVYIGQTKLENPRLGDIVSDKKLVELKSFKPLDFKGNLSIVNSWNSYGVYPAEEVVYPFVVRSFAAFAAQGAIGATAPIYTSGYESIGISHYCAAIVKAIFADAGYAVNGDIYNNETFLKMVMLYSSTEEQKWNYGALAPMQASCPPDPYSFGQVYAGGVKNTYERQSDMVQVLTYGWQAYDGDLCESLGDDGVYTCKYSGIYDFRVSATHAYNSSGNGNPSTGNGGFTVFRCISDDEFMPDTYLPTGANFGAIPALNTLDPGTLAVGGSGPFTFQVRLVAGKQYQVQRYVHFTSPTTAGSNSFLCYNPNEGNFFITKCDGPLTVNPANFLPDMTQQAFLKGIFKLFNLYYQLNEDTKTVTIFGRDDFFQESLQDIVNLSPYLSVDTMDETPFTEAEIASIYVNWKKDETDYILNKTAYMDLVNGSTPDGATELPFAPIGFLEVEYSVLDSNNTTVTGIDMIPAIIPSVDDVDTSILTDVEAESQPGSWVPRLMLYERNTVLKPNLTYDFLTKSNVKVALGRFYPASSTGIGGGYPFVEFAPKLTFFNITNQPFYKIDINQSLRSFSLTLYSGDNIYNPASSLFLADVNDVATLDNISLATNIDTVVNPKGFFFQLYGNDLLISDLSNYLQGIGRMDSVLWNKLTGRQVLRVGQDLFLLDGISNFDVSSKLATYKLYKLVSNIGVVATPGAGGAVLYSSTMTATASCPTNTSGADKTSTATRSSYVSQAQADQLAYNAALQLATSQLVCTVTGYVGHGVAGAACDNGSYGYEAIGTATYVSQISQIDAEFQAYQAAYADAQSKLVCYISPQIGGNMINNLITLVQGDLTPYATYADALASNFSNTTFYYAQNAIIAKGKPVYIQTQGYYYALIDGYYAFKYAYGTPNTNTVCGFQIINGKVDNYIDSVGAGATAP